MQIYGVLVAVVVSSRSILSFRVHGVVVEFDDYLASPPHPLFVGLACIERLKVTFLLVRHEK